MQQHSLPANYSRTYAGPSQWARQTLRNGIQAGSRTVTCFKLGASLTRAGFRRDAIKLMIKSAVCFDSDFTADEANRAIDQGIKAALSGKRLHNNENPEKHDQSTSFTSPLLNTKDNMGDLAVLTFQEAKDLLRISAPTLLGLVLRAEIPGRKVGKQWRFNKLALLNYVSGKDPVPRSRRKK